MIRIAFCSGRGGAGKTTCAEWVTNALWELWGRGVVLVDADPSGHAVQHADVDGYPFPVLEMPPRMAGHIANLEQGNLAPAGDADAVVVDCPQLEGGAFPAVCRGVIEWADHIVIPVKPSRELERMVPAAREIRALSDPDTSVSVLLYRLKGWGAYGEGAATALDLNGFRVLGTRIPDRERFARDPANGGALASPYGQLARELVDHHYGLSLAHLEES